MSISDLEPRVVWEQFEAITKVPRPSNKEEKIIEFLVAFAEKHGLEHKKDAAGNVSIAAAATAGMEDRPKVVLQSHMDMVCEKNADVEFDFLTDPIRTRIVDGWVKAEGTTLGADCGIGMAAALAMLISSEIPHGPIEALFTVNEEMGLTGAFNLGKDMISGKYLINLDSEDEGEIFIGCAGGIDGWAEFPLVREAAPAGSRFFTLSVSGLKGGHSGDNINDGLGNSNKIMARLLLQAEEKCGLRLVRFDGGNLRNAIPREAVASVAVPDGKAEEFRNLFDGFAEAVKAEYHYTDSGLTLACAEAESAEVLEASLQHRLLLALVGVPNGVLAMSYAMPGLVETSSNLASVKFADDKITVASSQRSSVESSKRYAAAAFDAVFTLAGAKVTRTSGYPGWTPDPDSRLLDVTRSSYERLFGKEPKVRAIHAGLECGLFLEKYPQLEMVSFGPTLRGVHSPDERLEIATVDKFWRLLADVLRNI